MSEDESREEQSRRHGRMVVDAFAELAEAAVPTEDYMYTEKCYEGLDPLRRQIRYLARRCRGLMEHVRALEEARDVHVPEFPPTGESATQQTQAARSEAPHPEIAVPPVDPEVLDRAVTDALRGTSSGVSHREPLYQALLSHVRNEVEQAVREQAPVIAAAAYRQGREDGLREASESVEELIEQNEINGARGRSEILGDALDSLRSLLTDKEGER